MKRITLIVTLALLIIALCAGLALAAPANEIWVDGHQVWSGSGSPNYKVEWGDTITYEPSTQTLTLNGAHITAGYKYDDFFDDHAGIYADGDLKIVLRGSNSIKPDNHMSYDGIVLEKYDTGTRKFTKTNLDISGSGSLSMETGCYGIYVFCGNLAITDCKIDIMAAEGGINITGVYDTTNYVGDGHITITDSDLTITAGFDSIYANGDITIDNSDLTVTAYYDGICTKYGDISIDNSKLTINAGLDEEGGDDGIYAFGDIAISDSYVITTGGEGDRGIYAGGIIDISNSYVYAEGGQAGMLARHLGEEGIIISTSDGIVYEGVIVKRGGKVVKVYNEFFNIEGYLTGYTFSETHQRITEEPLGDNQYNSPGAAQIVEMVPLAEVMELAVPILSGVGKIFPFVDVGLNHWAYNDIFDAFKKGLINGKSETLYLPDGPLTYAEAIKLAACIHQLNSMGAVSFEASDPWYQTYVSYAELNQIIQPGEFAGQYNDAIIRYDFAHIFGKALPISAFTPLNAIDSIPDVPSSNRHADEILMLYRAGILVGSDAAGNFNGGSNIKRSEVAAIVVRMIDPEKRVRK